MYFRVWPNAKLAGDRHAVLADQDDEIGAGERPLKPRWPDSGLASENLALHRT